MNELDETNSSFSIQNENNFLDLILYVSDKFDDKKNHNILMSTIKLIKVSQGFDDNYSGINVKRMRLLFVYYLGLLYFLVF